MFKLDLTLKQRLIFAVVGTVVLHFLEKGVDRLVNR